MTRCERAGLHPAELELRQYARGALESGHAVAILAHCLVCRGCLQRLRAELPGRPLAKSPPRGRRETAG